MIIAHDLGTTGNKASLHDESGRLLHAVTVTYPTHYASGGIAEQDARHWADAVIEATRRLVAEAEVQPRFVRAIAMSGQMMGTVLLDETYAPVRPALIWADSRSRAQADRLRERIPESDAYALLGHRINPTYSLEKIMWVAEHEPEVYERARYFCVAKDYVVHRLTGVLVTDGSDASGTNAWDQHRQAWSEEVIAAADVRRDLFVEVVDSTTVVGPLTEEAASACGLHTGVQVVIGGGDGPIAAVGAGVTSPGDGAYAYLGSSSWISLAHPTPIHDPQMRTMTFDHVVPGLFAPTATMVAGAGSLEWVAEVLAPDGGRGRVGRLLEGVGDVEAATEGLYFLPHLLGERSPHWNPAAAGAFVGIARQHTHTQLVRAVLEGVAFNLLTCLNAFREAGAQIDHVDAIGGGAASPAWLQILADVWGVPVHRRSIAEEGNSLGAAVTGLVGLGLIEWSAAGALSDVIAQYDPEPGRSSDYASRHEIFAGAYAALEPWFATRMGER